MKAVLTALLLILLIAAPFLWSSEIHDIVESGDIDRLKKLLQEAPERLDERDDHQTTPLLTAAHNGHKEICEYLLERGADLAAVNDRGSNALHLAAYKGHADLVEYFLDKGVDINSLSSAGFTPLTFAASQGQLEAVKVLVAGGADMNIADTRWGGSAIHWAVIGDNKDVLEYLVNAGEDINKPNEIDSSAPIIWAGHNGKIEALEFIINNGVDINSGSSSGWTALHSAARMGQIEAVRLLLENGARLDTGNDDGYTAFMAAAENGGDTLMQLLIDYGFDVSQPDDHGLTALHYAASWGSAELAELLIENGADINAVDSLNRTPLYRTIFGDNTQLAGLFIEREADVNIADADGVTPLRTAIMQGRDSIATMLIENRANLDIKDKWYNRTELHWACIKGNIEMAELLLNHGADANAIDNADCTPLNYAGKYGHKDVAELLVSHGAIAEKMENNYEGNKYLTGDINIGEAVIWYLGHCGFAVKTSKHLLIFDYWNNGREPGYPGLANGRINPEEIDDKNVYIFVTHEHRDHYDTTICGWDGTVENIKYIYGFQPEDLPMYRDSGYNGPEYEYFEPREQKSVDDMHICTIAANDAGVGFLVEVDGVVLYHAGDHAGWR